jgi:hypothetical protein
MRKLLVFAALLLGLICADQLGAFTWSGGGGTGSSGTAVNSPIIDCGGGFGQGTTHMSGNCGIFFPNSDSGAAGAFMLAGASNGAVPGMSGTAINMEPLGAVHNGVGVMYQPVQVPISKFSTTAVWVNNDWNFALVWHNTTNQAGSGPQVWGGAGCEGAFFQGFSVPTPPNNTFAVQFDQTQQIVETDSGFTYSGEGIFQSNVAGWSNPYVQCPCIPMSACGTNNTPTAITSASKVSTSPVPLNNPPATVATGTGHTYQAALTYDGTTLTVVLTDMTVGGSFTKTWPVNIATSIGQNKAWFGVQASTNAASALPLLLNSLTYSVPSPL